MYLYFFHVEIFYIYPYFFIRVKPIQHEFLLTSFLHIPLVFSSPFKVHIAFLNFLQKLELRRSSICFKGVMKYVTVQIIASLQLLLLVHVGECVPLSPGVGVLKLTILLFHAVFLFVKLNSIFQLETVVACTRIFSYNFRTISSQFSVKLLL